MNDPELESEVELSKRVSFNCQTGGNGLWSKVVKAVKINKLEVRCMKFQDTDLFGELLAFFNKKDWNCKKDGLIYSDNKWLSEFKNKLLDLGFSTDAINDVCYSEHGMQYANAVSLDVGEVFCKEAMDLLK